MLHKSNEKNKKVMIFCKACGTPIQDPLWITKPKRQIENNFCSFCSKKTPRKCARSDCSDTFLPCTTHPTSFCLHHRLERERRMFAGRR